MQIPPMNQSVCLLNNGFGEFFISQKVYISLSHCLEKICFECKRDNIRNAHFVFRSSAETLLFED